MHFKIALLVFKAVVQLLYVGVVSSSNVPYLVCYVGTCYYLLAIVITL